MSFAEDRSALIDTIEWYRDNYHSTDWCHSKMIEEIQQATNQQELEMYEKIVDGWFDY